MNGRIIRLISNQFRVLLDDGMIIDCLAVGRLKLEGRLVCGDFVSVMLSSDQYLITKRLKRHNYLVRPPIANVDQVLVVMSAVRPDFSGYLVDQLLFLSGFHEIKPALIITKLDLVELAEIEPILKDYRQAGYPVILAGKHDSLAPLIALLANKVSVLTGQSGVGKSTLLNRLDSSFKLATQDISVALGRGKHTTRHVELHPIETGWVADTPGFSKLDFSLMTPLELKKAVLDFVDYNDQCRFRDCLHVNEPACAVKEAVNQGLISAQRYQSYLAVLDLINESRMKLYG